MAAAPCHHNIGNGDGFQQLYSPYSFDQLFYYLAQYAFCKRKCSRMNIKRSKPWTKILLNLCKEKGLLLETVKTSKNLRECLKKFGIPYNSLYIRVLRSELTRQGINENQLFPKRYESLLKIPNELVFVRDSEYMNNRVLLKKRLLDCGILINKCSMLGCPNPNPVWNGKLLVLQLDHINGVSNDHRIENLRILCPNCHTQTETFAGRNRITPVIQNN